MNVNVYKNQVEYLRSRTDMVNSAIESALIPTIQKAGSIERVTEYFFDGNYVLAHNPAYKLVFKTSKLFYKKNGRVKTKFTDTITFALKSGETLFDLANTYNIPIETLILDNPDIPVNSVVNSETKDFENRVVKTRISTTVDNLNKYGIINRFLTFIDDHYVPMDKVSIHSDIDNDYIIVDLRGIEDWSDIEDFSKITLMFYEYATEDSSKGVGNPIFTFDNKGLLNSSGETKVYTTDPCLYHFEFFGDDNFGKVYNERLAPFSFREKIKRHNIFPFQKGKLNDNVAITINNGNIVSVKFEEFEEQSKIVVFYNSKVQYTEDNILRFSKDKWNDIADTFAMYLDMIASSCETFIEEIYNLAESDEDGEKYGFVFKDVRISGIEESGTPVDTLIFYTTEKAKKALKQLAKEIFQRDSDTVKSIINGIIDDAEYDEESFASMNAYEWNLRKNLPEMFKYTVPGDLPFLDNYNSLNESFNFYHKDTNSYEENLMNAISYIAKYDSDKLEKALPRYVYTVSLSGQEIRKFMHDDILAMGRYNNNENHRRNYVMIFKNGELLDTYHTIQYDYLNFTVQMNPYFDTDRFDFVFFLLCNNIIFPMTCNDEMIQNVTVFNHNEVMLFDSKIRGNTYSPVGNHVHYSIPFTIDLPYVSGTTTVTPGGGSGSGGGFQYSVMTRTGVVLHFDDNDVSIDDFIYFISQEALNAALAIIDEYITDSEMNALFRNMANNAKNKSNINDELALRVHLSDTLYSADGVVDTVIEKILALKDDVAPPEDGGNTDGSGESRTVLLDDPELYKLKLTEEDLTYYKNDAVTVCSRRQFRYQRFELIRDAIKSFQLNEDFDFCVNQDQYMVFVNHRLVPKTYVMATPLADTPVTMFTLYINVDLYKDDIVEVFYVSEPLYNDFNPSVLPKSDETNSGYIRINKSENLVGLNKNSALVFVNGKKISYNDILDVCNNTIKVLDTSTSKESMGLSLDIYRYLRSDDNITLKEFAPSKLDGMIPSKTEKIDSGMNVVNKEPQSNEDEFFEPIEKDTIRDLLYEDYMTSSLDDSWIAFF